MILQQKTKDDITYDAIVIGSGISGGYTAKELCEAGLKTLVLERGKNVVHVEDYPTAFQNPWDQPHRGKDTLKDKTENPIVNKCYAYDEFTKDFFTKDNEQPYVQKKPFDWIRGYQVGGKSLIWARQTQRWSDYEFEGPLRDEFAVDWPIRYKDIAPFYDKVERFAGISGNKDGIKNLPDGIFLKPFEMNCLEKHLKTKIENAYKDRKLIIGRCAHLTDPQEHHLELGRGQCQARHLCYRGCPYGAYFSSNSATLPAAAKTGNLKIMPNSIVHSILYDKNKQKAIGVSIIDPNTNNHQEVYAKIIFLNASTINSNAILLNSVSSRFPNGLGNDSGLLGKYIAFHQYQGSVTGNFEGLKDKYFYGRRPTSTIIPNFRNLDTQDTDFLRGYNTFLSAGRQKAYPTESFGANFKKDLSKFGLWNVFVMIQGETIPKESNYVALSEKLRDQFDIPQIEISVDYDDNDRKMLEDFYEQTEEMLSKGDIIDIKRHNSNQNPGLDIHEMGGVRMGNDSKTSLLNKYNQLHHCKNVFVTDGSCMTSVGNTNPSLTFMALTARAVDYAVQNLNV